MSTLSFQSALLPDGWARDVSIDIDASGTVRTITANSGVGAHGCALPGIANLHSHAHQRAMAGLAEKSGTSADSFWTWRKTMYGFLDTMTPPQLHAIASQLYVEMLKAGYTRVAEFQYLHHQPNGMAYEQRAEMSLQTLRAALDVGIGITNLPVHYQHGGFRQQPINTQQKRFYNSPENYVNIVEIIRKHSAQHTNANTGIAAHSLRAVDAESFKQVISELSDTSPFPVHIHIAEQVKEVEDCLSAHNQRPVAYLLDRFPVNQHWCLIHATHMDATETQHIAKSGAVVGLCPTTEANLGDGLFNATDFLQHEGRLGIGSDSHISVSPTEELRWLEYGQRLLKQSRNVLSLESNKSTGRYLLEQVAVGGAQACGNSAGTLAPGQSADFIVLDTSHPLLCEREDDAIVDSWIFSGNQSTVQDVYVGGTKVIDHGHHANEIEIEQNFKSTLRTLRQSL